MFSTVLSAALDGMNVELVHVEADVSNGLPMFHMVGYLSGEVKEAGERVKTALINSGFSVPPKKIIINLAPATVKKRGSSFDLPIALALLETFSYLEEGKLENIMTVGELGLNGEVLKVPGVLPIVMEAKRRGCTACLVPMENVMEGQLVDNMEIIGVGKVMDVLDFLSDKESYLAEQKQRIRDGLENESSQLCGNEIPDFADIQGQHAAKRAAEIAVSGQHNILMIGTPGASKTMIAKRISTILPPMSKEELLEISKIYSVAGLLGEQAGIRQRPFRQIHHTATKAALIGGGIVPSPGEISLAHGGVLMMDELAEFPKTVLEVLRQPLEEREIQIIRTRGTYRFPADFLLFAAMNKRTLVPIQVNDRVRVKVA
ncbi:MAG: YifB family Mg chelatase-like AAA ATPase [Hespellia sp.]|nr:YifB family Mg chelatase-like AAA ATPase [Hespellia sp.]